MYHPHRLWMSWRARSGYPEAKWASSSMDEMKGEMFPGSSGLEGPRGVQFETR